MKNLNRRDFHQLALSAMGGLAAGTLIGCGSDSAAKKPEAGKKPDGKADGGTKDETAVAKADGGEMHACRGMNACKGKGGCGETVGKNTCAGQGGCAPKAAHHECKGHNACKGQGGCGESAGANECKGHGNCAVPLKPEAWAKARAGFEKKMKAAGKTVGAAPETKKAS